MRTDSSYSTRKCYSERVKFKTRGRSALFGTASFLIAYDNGTVLTPKTLLKKFSNASDYLTMARVLDVIDASDTPSFFYYFNDFN